MSSQGNLPDAASRSTVANELQTTLFVEAGAGTGKTSSLVTRIVNLVASGVPVARIAAITFTEAAASELRIRVRDALAKRGEAANDRSMIEAAGEVEAAAFTTLHGFALRLLADHPIEAGLPPGFGVADEIGSALEFELAWKNFVAEMSDNLDHLELLERAAALNTSLSKFPDIARKFDDNWDLLGQFATPKPLSKLDFEDLFDEVDEFVALGSECAFAEDKLAQRIALFAQQIDWLRPADPVDQLAAFSQLKYPPKNVGKKSNWPHTPVADIRVAIDELKDRITGTIAEHTQEVIDHMVVLIAEFVETRVQARRNSGQLSFHDLLVLARQLVRSDPLVRERLHQRYSKVLLDEFQDTDPIQIELAVLLATSEADVEGHSWPALAERLEPGRLVVVGDPKQSIYRFRRADIGVYSAAEEALVESATKLTTNFRSVPQVIDWVNHAFGTLMGDGEPGVQPRYTPLQAHRNGDHETPAAVRFIGGPSDDYLREIRDNEAQDVAAVVSTAINEGWRVEKSGKWEPLKLSDIAVLIPSRLSLPALETSFGAAGIAYRPETSSLVYSTQEIRDVLAGVKAIGDPTNSVHVVAALRSSLFAVSDEDLTSWYALGGRWDYRNIVDHDDTAYATPHPVAEAFEVLRSWHQQRWWTQPSELIVQIVRDRRLREQALAMRRPRDRWRRYRFIAEQARQFSSKYGGDLNDFIEWVEVQGSDTARVVEPIPPEPDDDSVRILTIHGSKGLEFPMVIVAGAATQESSGGRRVQALFPPDAPPQVKIGSEKTTKEFSVYASVEDALDASERIRLDYVAATRARDLLVISAHHKSSGRASSGLRTWRCLEGGPSYAARFERVGDEMLPTPPAAQLRMASGGLDERRAQWESEQAGLLELNQRSQRWSASAVAAALGATVPIHNNEHAPSGSAVELDRAALGSAVHEVLGSIERPEEVAGLVESVSQRFGVAADAVGELVEAALESDIYKVALKNRHWRELYVSMPTKNGSLDGYIDLCFSTGDGFVIVDYKTDRLVDGVRQVAEKLAQYRHQIACYVLMLEHVTGQKVSDAQLLFLDGGAHPASFEDLEEAKQQVAELIGL